jgi:pimeloyl-ACP methyl ester carboxylesterase
MKNVQTMLKAYGAAVRAVGTIAPEFAADLTARHHLTVRPIPVRPEERAILDGARQTEVRVGQLSVAVYQWGTGGPAATLVHGWNGHAGQMTPFVQPLRALGYRVVAFDAPAHGRSRGKLSHVPEMADALRAVVDAVGGTEVIVAHSIGATVATLAVARGLEVGRLAMIAPSVSATPWVERTADMLGLNADLRARHVAKVEQICGAPLPEVEMAACVDAITVPVIAIMDRADRMADVREARPVVERMARVRLVETHGLGHLRILSNAAVVEAVSRFVAGEDDVALRPKAREHAPSPRLRDPWFAAHVEQVASAL